MLRGVSCDRAVFCVLIEGTETERRDEMVRNCGRMLFEIEQCYMIGVFGGG